MEKQYRIKNLKSQKNKYILYYNRIAQYMSRLVTKEDVQIYKGKYYLPWFKKDEVVHFSVPKKVVVLDLDETLGSFADLYIICLRSFNLPG